MASVRAEVADWMSSVADFDGLPASMGPRLRILNHDETEGRPEDEIRDVLLAALPEHPVMHWWIALYWVGSGGAGDSGTPLGRLSVESEEYDVVLMCGHDVHREDYLEGSWPEWLLALDLSWALAWDKDLPRGELAGDAALLDEVSARLPDTTSAVGVPERRGVPPKVSWL